MVQIAGNYTPTEFVNTKVILKAVGCEVTDESIAGYEAVSTTVESNGDNYVFASKVGDQVVHEAKFTLGKSYEEQDGKLTTTVTKEGNTFTFMTKSSAGTIKRTFEFNDTGTVMHFLSYSGETAKVTYKRV